MNKMKTMTGDQYIKEHANDELPEFTDLVRFFQDIVDKGLGTSVTGKNKETLDTLVSLGLVRKK